MLRFHLLRDTADAYFVTGSRIRVSHSSEDLKGSGEIAQDNTVVCEDSHAAKGSLFRVWLDSCEHCHSSHWFPLWLNFYPQSRRNEWSRQMYPPWFQRTSSARLSEQASSSRSCP